jgi:spermidine synthase/MFS family permease
MSTTTTTAPREAARISAGPEDTVSPALRHSPITTGKVALLLFGSGLCALIYQMAWLREFRLIFGASTASSAAVLAIFMLGLGLGSLVLGPRADRKARPLGFYSNLELVIAISAALTPLLLTLVRHGYIASGGSTTLGLWGATVVRLLMSGLVLLVPTFLMGGTLPAAARSVESDEDVGRRNLALLYGANPLGAVTGTVVANFFLLEMFGTRKMLWAACLVNALVALIARNLSNRSEVVEPAGEPNPERTGRPTVAEVTATASARPVLDGDTTDEGPVPASFVLAASAVVGFSFLLMELVWYRMLSPILGGSTFTFGLILAVALFGIGLGGAAYAVFRGNKAATLTGFALTCGLEAAFIALPFAIGDRLAMASMLLRSMSGFGFYGLVLGWSAIASVAVLPAAFISGVQFPLLIALLGRGRQAVGRHTGMAYTANTIGAIVGSLAGGFGLLPLLTAPWVWRLVVILLALLALAALALSLQGVLTAGADAGKVMARRLWPAVTAAAALLMITATGPSAAWRHGGIGAGRADAFDSTPNSLRNFIQNHRRAVKWEADGVESSVALDESGGYAFYVNGKSDGHVRDDAGTQVMSGLVGAILHPNPRSAMVIGLGTGSTAGWLGSCPTIERVDVAELEPAILEVARRCAPANRDVLRNPKVHVTINDAREQLLTTRNTYDLIFSEPSNPYRAGVASLYTQEFYEAVSKKLNPGGFFLQWVQAYEVDGQTVRTVYATFNSVFPYVETWQTQSGDTLLLGSLTPVKHDATLLREKITQDTYRFALANVWRVVDLEGFLAHHIANDDFTRDVAKVHNDLQAPLNTDDRTVVEFGFARSVGSRRGVTPADMLLLSQSRKHDRPNNVSGDVDWELVQDRRISMMVYEGRSPVLPPDAPLQRRQRAQAMIYLLQGNAPAAIQMWRQQPREASDTTEWMFLAVALNESGSPEAEQYIEKIRQIQPTEAEALTAHLRWRQRKPAETAAALVNVFNRYRSDPWPQRDLMRRTISLAIDVANGDRQGNVARMLYDALSTPFVLKLCEDWRMRALVKIGGHLDAVTGSGMLPIALDAFEPNVPWEDGFLVTRYNAYVRAGHKLAMKAAEDLDEFRENEPFPLDYKLRQEEQPYTRPSTNPTSRPVMSPFAPLAEPGEGPGSAGAAGADGAGVGGTSDTGRSTGSAPPERAAPPAGQDEAEPSRKR